MKSTEFKKIKKIIGIIINLLEKSVLSIDNSIKLSDKNNDLLNFVIGHKENIVSVLNKLTSMLIKIDPFTNDNKNNNVELEKDDINIIIDYINKRNKDEINR